MRVYNRYLPLKSARRFEVKQIGFMCAGVICAMLSANAGNITVTNPTSVTISLSSDLTVTGIADPVLVYQYFDGTIQHLGAVLLGSPIPTGVTGPFLETINTPAGFVSGTATIFGLYLNPANPGGCPAGPTTNCGIAMAVNTTAGATLEPGTTYAAAFPSGSGYPAETTLGPAILLQNSTGDTALENFFAISTADWVPFTVGLSSTTVDTVLFSTSNADGTFTINGVQAGTPEPATWLLLAGGIAAMAAKRRAAQR
jgi:hypothetical protein